MAPISRREFVWTTAAGAAALATGTAFAQTRTRREIPIAVQMYILSQPANADLPGTLAAVKQAGFDAVEFAGYLKRDAKTLRQHLDDEGLKCCGSHVPGGLSALTVERLPETIEFNRILGNTNLIVPSLGGSNLPKTLDGWTTLAATFSEIAERAKPAGMKVGFHNHEVEFTPVDGQIPYEYLFTKASRDVYMQVDVGLAARAGQDPAALISKFPGRVVSLHLKEFDPNARIAEGKMRWQEIIRAAENNPSIQYYIMEHGRGLEAAVTSIQDFKKQLAARS